MPKYHIDPAALRREVADRLVGTAMFARSKRIAWFYSIMCMTNLNVGPLGPNGEIAVFGTRKDCIDSYRKTAKRQLCGKTYYRYFDILQGLGLVSLKEDGRVILNVPIPVTEIDSDKAGESLEVRPADVRSTGNRTRSVDPTRRTDVVGRITAG